MDILLTFTALLPMVAVVVSTAGQHGKRLAQRFRVKEVAC